MRQIILDTETTGLEWKKGNRIVEIGCVELFKRRPTGNNYHQYIAGLRVRTGRAGSHRPDPGVPG